MPSDGAPLGVGTSAGLLLLSLAVGRCHACCARSGDPRHPAASMARDTEGAKKWGESIPRQKVPKVDLTSWVKERWEVQRAMSRRGIKGHQLPYQGVRPNVWVTETEVTGADLTQILRQQQSGPKCGPRDFRTRVSAAGSEISFITYLLGCRRIKVVTTIWEFL
ncbi:hypothetical protein GGX14DRAFT_401678 [Mycena pura]|uniref:Uncharacterized protein n=1 Tax=Mycena pura TaxID=153505 RepID=A0AAD6V3R6_9AGAR|nr:hypothetical protein GGX14DRAFT_401678 [Mycena pura]